MGIGQKIFSFEINPEFRNNWGFAIVASCGKNYEIGLNYLARAIGLYIWGQSGKYRVGFGDQYEYKYNWNKMYLAYQNSGYAFLSIGVIPQISFSLMSNFWFEWDTLNILSDITPSFTPRIEFALRQDISINVFSEFVIHTQPLNPEENNLRSCRQGLLFSWNFGPKTWFYVAYSSEYVKNTSAKLQLDNRITNLKLKYLFPF